MGTIWCEYEPDDVPDSDVEEFGGVQVHKKSPWHLLSGEVIEMTDGAPLLDRGRPVVMLEEFEVAEEE